MRPIADRLLRCSVQGFQLLGPRRVQRAAVIAQLIANQKAHGQVRELRSFCVSGIVNRAWNPRLSCRQERREGGREGGRRFGFGFWGPILGLIGRLG